MRCIGTDAGVACDKDAQYPDIRLCQKHYMRHYRWERGGTNPTCPVRTCEGRLEIVTKPTSVGRAVARKRRCKECKREYLTLESVIPRRMMGELSETLLNAFSERTLSATDTPVVAVDDVDAASTSPTT